MSDETPITTSTDDMALPLKQEKEPAVVSQAASEEPRLEEEEQIPVVDSAGEEPTPEEAARLEEEKQILADQVLILRKRLVEMNGGTGENLESVPEDTPADLGMIEFKPVEIAEDDEVQSFITFDQSASSGWTSRQSQLWHGSGGPSLPPINQFEPSLEIQKKNPNSVASLLWRSISFLCTFLVPDACIPRVGSSAKQYWREKVALCILALIASSAFVGGLGFVPLARCRSSTSDASTKPDLWKNNGSTVTSIFGELYDTSMFSQQHPGGSQFVSDLWGKDASHLFPRLPPSQLPSFCVDESKTDFLTRNSSPICDPSREHCHSTVIGRKAVRDQFFSYSAGKTKVSQDDLNAMHWIQINDSIYNVTTYVESLRNKVHIDSDPDHPNAFLYRPMHDMILARLNGDATDFYHSVFDTNTMKEQCLDELFYVGEAPPQEEAGCGSSPLAYLLFYLVAAVATTQAVAALAFAFHETDDFEDSNMSPGVAILVTCNSEGEQELRETFESCLLSSYPEDGKIMVVIADGDVTGVGETRSTPEIVANILGFETQCGMEDLYSYESIGKHAKNTANVYTGIYTKEFGEGSTRSLNYVVVCKRGLPEERSQPGVRGKRDSQLILLGLLNRIRHSREPNSLDIALVKALFASGVPVKDIDYMLTLDCGSRLARRSIAHMVYNMEVDKEALACSGEKLIGNKTESWVTMIQIFDTYYSQLVKKSLESIFGCVTSLNAGFTMYRIYNGEMECLLSDDLVYQEYSRRDVTSLHETILFDTDDDRVLTTLLQKRFPLMQLRFVPDATCIITVPHKFYDMMSQRRHQFVTQFHNNWVILNSSTTCCFSLLRLATLADLLAGMIIPAVLVYMSYLVFSFIANPEGIDRIVLIICGYAIAVQVLCSLIHFRWGHLIWFPAFLLAGIPITYILLPVYSFLKMDELNLPRVHRKRNTEKPGSQALQKERSLRTLQERSEVSSNNFADTSQEGRDDPSEAVASGLSLAQRSSPSVQGIELTLSQTDTSSESDSPEEDAEAPSSPPAESKPGIADESIAANESPSVPQPVLGEKVDL